MLWRWILTVPSLMKSFLPISILRSPAATCLIISISLGVADFGFAEVQILVLFYLQITSRRTLYEGRVHCCSKEIG